MKYSIIIHGGAGSGSLSLFKKIQNKNNIPNNLSIMYENALTECLQVGINMLESGNNAIDTCTKTIMALENNELFNAGYGSVFDRNGNIFHDAVIMDGSNMRWGGVCYTNIIKNPISMANSLIQENVLIAGNENIKPLAKKYKVELVDNMDYFKSNFRIGMQQVLEDLGTVGVVVYDSKGNIAAGTSTGGRYNKIPGRIGDAAMIGNSTIADNKVCGISTTGFGEYIITNNAASQIKHRMELGNESIESAINATINKISPHSVGIIGIDRNGKIYHSKNTERMYVAWKYNDSNINVKTYLQ